MDRNKFVAQRIFLLVAFILLCGGSSILSNVVLAHEHTHTHQGLTISAYRLLDSSFLNNDNHAGLTPAEM